MFEVVNERNLYADLNDGHNTTDDVQLVGVVLHLIVEGPRDDGEDHVEKGEDRGKP